MSWFMAGAAAISIGTSVIGGMQQRNSSIRSINSASLAEGEQITAERLNKSIQNSYSTALAQMQLGLEKRKLSQNSADISSAGVMAMGDVDLAAASTGSIGASTAAVSSDVQMKVNQAQAQVDAQWEQTVENYNNDLNLMVLNTDQSAPNVRRAEYNGPGVGGIIGTSVMNGLAQFASSYAMSKMQLGLGSKAPSSQYSLGSTTKTTGLNLNSSVGFKATGGSGLRF